MPSTVNKALIIAYRRLPPMNLYQCALKHSINLFKKNKTKKTVNSITVKCIVTWFLGCLVCTAEIHSLTTPSSYCAPSKSRCPNKHKCAHRLEAGRKQRFAASDLTWEIDGLHAQILSWFLRWRYHMSYVTVL